jgi:hypothetical protein
MYELPVLNVQGLVTDVAVLRGISDQFLIHVSGTHGCTHLMCISYFVSSYVIIM